jgi:hypothetical protein
MEELTADDLDIIASIDDGIAPHDWRNNSNWYEGKMVKPSTPDATNYCATNGTYFIKPNAYFIEGFEDGDCDDVEVLATGAMPPLGGLCQERLTEIWLECFAQPNIIDPAFRPRPTPTVAYDKAHPHPPIYAGEITGYGIEGMNLRTYFAAKILSAILSRDDVFIHMTSDDRSHLATQAVGWADSLAEALAK